MRKAEPYMHTATLPFHDGTRMRRVSTRPPVVVPLLVLLAALILCSAKRAILASIDPYGYEGPRLLRSLVVTTSPDSPPWRVGDRVFATARGRHHLRLWGSGSAPEVLVRNQSTKVLSSRGVQLGPNGRIAVVSVRSDNPQRTQMDGMVSTLPLGPGLLVLGATSIWEGKSVIVCASTFTIGQTVSVFLEMWDVDETSPTRGLATTLSLESATRRSAPVEWCTVTAIGHSTVLVSWAEMNAVVHVAGKRSLQVSATTARLLPFTRALPLSCPIDGCAHQPVSLCDGTGDIVIEGTGMDGVTRETRRITATQHECPDLLTLTECGATVVAVTGHVAHVYSPSSVWMIQCPETISVIVPLPTGEVFVVGRESGRAWLALPFSGFGVLSVAMQMPDPAVRSLQVFLSHRPQSVITAPARLVLWGLRPDGSVLIVHPTEISAPYGVIVETEAPRGEGEGRRILVEPDATLTEFY